MTARPLRVETFEVADDQLDAMTEYFAPAENASLHRHG